MVGRRAKLVAWLAGRRAKRVAWLVLLLVLDLAVLEGLVRWWVRDPDRLAMLSSGVDAPTWRLAWVLRRATGDPTGYAIDVYHPTRGWALKPGLRRVPVSGAPVSSTALGARGTREVAAPKPPGTRRILVFGDSYAFGEEVGDDETFAARLEGLLPDVEVVNLGVHGYGHDQMLLHLRESAARYEPDVVLLGYLYPDDARNALSFRDFAKPYFELVDGALVLRGVPVPAPEEVLAAEPYRSKLVDLVEATWRRQRRKHGGLLGEIRALSDALVVAFAASARDLGATPLVVYFPMTNELDDSAREPVGREKEVAELCRARGIPFLSLRERFHRTLLGHERTTVHHWDAVEHATAADEMAAFVRRSGLLGGRAAPGG